jgi:UDP-3-O-[3-hydroxymyristoyl] glucosamine N-acyltransferase
VAEPSHAFQQALEFFFAGQGATASGWSGIHPSAVIHPTARLGERVTVGPLVVIEKDVVIGDDTTISAHSTIGVGVTIGQKTFLHANVVIRERCQIGSRVILQPGVVIGSCGFGYRIDENGHHQKVPQVGIVEIGDDTEIGANTTIDRARFGKTVIGKGVKIDNLCQIGHNVTLGDHSIMVALSGIAGSAKVGSHVIMAGQVAINSHITIADGTILAARTAVAKSIEKPGRYAGVPAEPLGKQLKSVVATSKLAEHMSEYRKFKQQVSKLLGIAGE